MERSSGLLARRKALVTGGETGIGVAIARALAWRGGLHDLTSTSPVYITGEGLNVTGWCEDGLT